MTKLDTLYSTNKGSHKVTKDHEDSENSNSNSKSSSKMSFWVHQTYLQGLKGCLMQLAYVIILSL
jgi:SPX domain protein involved in polyphosphate accumulation